jgi:hypothetical protein
MIRVGSEATERKAMNDQEKPRSLGEALLFFQRRAIKITKNATAKVQTQKGPGYEYSYLTLDKLLDEVLPVLTELGLLWISYPTTLDDGQTPALSYRMEFMPNGDGESGYLEQKMPLMLRGGTPQDLGAAISFARRYSMLAVLNLAPDKDEDGQIATQQPGGKRGVKKLTRAKARQLIEQADQAGVKDKLRLAANHAHKSDIGEDLERGLMTLSPAEGQQVAEWVAKKAREALQ